MSPVNPAKMSTKHQTPGTTQVLRSDDKGKFTELGLDVAAPSNSCRRPRGVSESRSREMVADHQGRQHIKAEGRYFGSLLAIGRSLPMATLSTAPFPARAPRNEMSIFSGLTLRTKS